MSPIERAARALCERSGVANPDDLEPGNDPYSDDTEIIDGYLPNGEPGFFVWRLYVGRVRTVLNAMREASHAMQKAACEQRVSFHSGSGMWDVGKLSMEYPDETDKGAGTVWQAMIDAALREGG